MFTFCCVFLLLLLLVTLARADSGRDRCEEMFVCAMAELFFSFTYFCRRRFKRSTHAMTLTSPVVGFRNQKKTLCASFFRRRLLFSPLPNTKKKSKVSSCFIIGPICAPRLSSSGGIEKSSRKERRNERYRY